ncbi:PP2C family protein-serine/threonine phosphatase [Catenuloplanes sp. NPDC051500]|uniref:PP2C family protein-serine/threonine phosphatase n=1 Tax=Catenuloplanes sp. NPDC051500 TaxID=3363959 RepID=UPI0037B8EA39
MSAAPACPEHGEAYDDAVFCEVCGRNLLTGALPAPRPVPPAAGGAEAGRPDRDGAGSLPRAAASGGDGVPAEDCEWVSARESGGKCAACGAVGDADNGWCNECGRRLSAARDRAELELDGIAAVTDKARRRHNEDAVAIGRAGDARVAVVCDGISTARRADAASTVAAEAGMIALLGALAGSTGDSRATPHHAATTAAAPHSAVTATPHSAATATTPHAATATTPHAATATTPHAATATTPHSVAAATVRAAADAAKAAAGTGRAEDGDSPPGCTYVSAVVAADGVTVGWIGDSRAYWVGADGDAQQLTVDDSLAAIHAAGRRVPDGLQDADPESLALVRWLGADSGEVEAQVISFRPARPGLVIVCTDGLSHYLPTAADLAAEVARHDGVTPLRLAAELTATAIRAGGHDNIAVAILPVTAGPNTDSPEPDSAESGSAETRSAETRSAETRSAETRSAERRSPGTRRAATGSTERSA